MTLPHPYAVPGTWHCTACGAGGDSEAEPIYCARCGSVYLIHAEGGDDDGEWP